MSPVEWTVAFHHQIHLARVHPIAVREDPLLQIWHQMVDDLGRSLPVRPHCLQELDIRAWGQFVESEQAGIQRGIVHEHPAEHPQGGLVRLCAVGREQIDRPNNPGMLPREFIKRVRRRTDDAKSLQRLGRRLATGQVTEHLLHFGGQPRLVIPVLRVADATDLVLKDPRQIEVQVHGAGIQRNALRSQQVDTPVHPAPALRRHLRGGGDVVGEVPRLKCPDFLKPRLQRRDPLAQGLGLVKLPFRLEVIGPRPEQVYRQPTKRSQRRGHDRHMGRHALHALHRDDQLQVTPLTLDDAGDGPGRRQRG